MLHKVWKTRNLATAHHDDLLHFFLRFNLVFKFRSKGFSSWYNKLGEWVIEWLSMQFFSTQQWRPVVICVISVLSDKRLDWTKVYSLMWICRSMLVSMVLMRSMKIWSLSRAAAVVLRKRRSSRHVAENSLSSATTRKWKKTVAFLLWTKCVRVAQNNLAIWHSCSSVTYFCTREIRDRWY